MPSSEPTSTAAPRADDDPAAEACRAHVVWGHDLLGYDFGPGHPMAPTRLDLTMRLVQGLGLLDGPDVDVVAPLPAPDDVLRTVHDPEYVAAVREASARGTTDPHRGLGTEDDPVAHHGDGVEEVFWDDPRVLTVSVHQSGVTLFPGTGHAADVGGPGAEGT